MNPHTVIFDGHNLLHRANSGFTLGEHPLMFNFMRSLRALVEQLKPTRAVMVLDGKPAARLAAFPEYKANRVILESAREAHDNFVEQCDDILDLMRKHIPVSLMWHPQEEADDLVYTIVKNGAKCVQYTVVSSDSDFTQMLNEFDNVKLYNPVKKTYVEKPVFDYVLWKALKGDASDNIPGCGGIGVTKATEYATNIVSLENALLEGTIDVDILERNIALIRLKHLPPEEWNACTSSSPVREWDTVKKRFEEYDFKSIVKDTYWERFCATFDALWEIK